MYVRMYPIPLLPSLSFTHNSFTWLEQIYIYMHSLSSQCSGEAITLDTHVVFYPNNEYTKQLNSGCYRVHIFAINNLAWGPYSDPFFFNFTRNPPSLQELSGKMGVAEHFHLTSNIFIPSSLPLSFPLSLPSLTHSFTYFLSPSLPFPFSQMCWPD